MKSRISAVVLAVALAVSTFCGLLFPVSTYAANKLTEDACKSATADQKAALGCQQNNTAPSVVTNILNGVIAVLAIVAVIVIVVAGYRYIVSQGDPGKITQAKNMIVYGIAGLIVAGLAFAIINFVITGVTSS